MTSNKTVVLVTGANRGIGYEIVSALLRSPATQSDNHGGAPYHVFLGSRSLENGQAAAEKLSSAGTTNGSSVTAVALDVTSASSIAAAVSQVASSAGRLDVLVNNAGIVVREADQVEALRKTLETNTIAPFAVLEAFKPLLLTTTTKGGEKTKRHVVVSSDLGSLGLQIDPNYKHAKLPATAYRMSKAAVDMMVANQHVLEAGFKSFAWSPGWTATGLTGDEEDRRKNGANDPRVVSEGFVRIVEGSLDEKAGTLLDEHLQVQPW